MNILFFEWDALMQQDLEAVFMDKGISFRRFSYAFENMYEDEFFIQRFDTHIKNHSYDLVMSFNYFPLVSSVCKANNLLYISWNYDSPVRLEDYSSFANENNLILMFDKKETMHYQSLGFQTVYHMPLAVYPKRLNQLVLTPKLQEMYGCKISFIGNLHHGNLEQFLTALPEFEWGFVKALVNTQLLLTSVSVTDLIPVDEILTRWNPYFQKYTGNPDYRITQEDFLFLFGQYASEIERKALLQNLGSHFSVDVYSNDFHSLPKNIHYKGTADYYSAMPYIFKASKINLNPTFRCIQSGIPLRILDILGVGGFLMTNGQPELYDYFTPGEDLVIYEDLNHALDLADYYLSHDSERNAIAQKGQLVCQEQFSYDVILPKIFELAERMR